MKSLDFELIKNLINKSQQSTSFTNLTQCTFVIGDTGSGKSTLINSLIGKELIAVEKDDDLDGQIILKF